MKSKWTIISGFISLTLLVSLIIKLNGSPDGLILSGLFLGLISIGGIVVACIIIGGLTKLFFKNSSFPLVFAITTSFGFLAFHYFLYSPVLKITVPKNYTGQVALVLSNLKEDILTADTNGIGYITEWTFKHNYKAPIVVESDGKDICDRCVGFNPSTFWAQTESSSSKYKNKIISLTFEIVSTTDKGKKQYRSWDVDQVDTSKVLKNCN